MNQDGKQAQTEEQAAELPLHPSLRKKELWFCSSHPFPWEYSAPLVSFTKTGRLRRAALELYIMAPEGKLHVQVHQGIVGVHLKREPHNSLLRFSVPADITHAGLEWIYAQDTFREAVMAIGREAVEPGGFSWESYFEASKAISAVTHLPDGSPLRFAQVLTRDQTAGWFEGMTLPRRLQIEEWAELKERHQKYSAITHTASKILDFAAQLGVALSRFAIEEYLKGTVGLAPDVDLLSAGGITN